MNLDALKRKLLVKYPFFGSILANVNYIENTTIQVAATDGEDIYYNPTFLENLSQEEQTFIFAHEVCHIAFNHPLRSEGKDPELWNIATDAVINQFLKRDGLKMVDGGVDIAEAINYDAEELYEKLLEEKDQKSQQDQSKNQDQQQQQSGESGQGGDSESQEHQQQQGGESGQDGDPENQDQQQTQGGESGQDGDSENQEQNENHDVGHDTHSMWDQAVKNHKNKKKEKIIDKILNRKSDNNLEEKQQELEEMGEKQAFNQNLEDRKKQLEELKAAIAKQASQAGSSTNRETRQVDNIGTAKPIIDWRYVLREAVKHDVDWSYKNAAIEDGVVVANLEEIPLPETEIVLDTSGSINETLLKNFLRECKNILKHTKLKVGCFDTEFYGFHEIRTEEDIERMRFQGGGGTDFNAAVNAFSRRVENKIIFTDGEAEEPDMPMDAIWLVFGETEIHPKGGRVIQINQEQLSRLSSFIISDDYQPRKR